METNISQEPQAEAIGVSRPGLLLSRVHSIYLEKFWQWFGIMAPTSLLAGLMWVLIDQKIRAILRDFDIFQVTHSDQTEIFALRLGELFLSWLLGCFALAATATVVNNLTADDSGEQWRPDSYTRAREHLGALFSLALITSCAFAAGIYAVNFVGMTTNRALHWKVHLPLAAYAFEYVEWILVAGIVSWISVSIPLVLKGDLGILSALKKSVELSNGYEGALFLLVIESLVGGYIAWYVVLHGMPMIVPATMQQTFWYGWVLNIAGVLASAAVDPPLFIGLALLAEGGSK